MSNPALKGELLGIQYLRGIAAMLVVVFHLGPQLERMGYKGGWLPGLTAGVDIFFVVSGFIMWMTTWNRPMATWQFWIKRIVRIVPLYWLFTAIMTVAMIVAPTLLQSSRFDASHVLASFAFVAWQHPAKPALEPVVMPGWTLNYEMFFYFIFGLFMSAPKRFQFIGTIGALISLVAIGFIANFQKRSLPGFYTDSVMVEFALGMGLGWLATRASVFPRMPVTAAAALIAAGLVATVFTPAPPGSQRLLTHGLAAMVVVAGVLALETRGIVRDLRVPRLLGDASYSIYLSQLLTLSAVGQAWRKLHMDHSAAGLAAFCVTAVVIAAAVGIAVYTWIEKPLTTLFRQRRPMDASAPGGTLKSAAE